MSVRTMKKATQNRRIRAIGRKAFKAECKPSTRISQRYRTKSNNILMNAYQKIAEETGSNIRDIIKKMKKLRGTPLHLNPRNVNINGKPIEKDKKRKWHIDREIALAKGGYKRIYKKNQSLLIKLEVA